MSYNFLYRTFRQLGSYSLSRPVIAVRIGPDKSPYRKLGHYRALGET